MRKYLIAYMLVVVSTSFKLNAQTNSWMQKADLSTVLRSAPVGFGINNKGYVLTGLNSSGTGLNDLWQWNQNTNVWTQKADLPGQARFSAVAFSIGSKGYITTGWTQAPSVALQDLWEFNTNTNTWTAKNNFGGAGRYTASSFVIAGNAYVGMGYGPLKKDLWKYNQAGNAWTQMADLPGSSRQAASGFSIGNYGYIACGNNGLNLAELWRFDPVSNSWVQKANFPGAVRYACAAFVINGKAYVGTGGTSNVFYQDFYRYDPLTDQWSAVPSLPGPGRRHSASFTVNGKGYLSCGSTTGTALNDLWEFNPNAFYFSVTSTNLNCNNVNDGTATVIANGVSPISYLWTPGNQTTATATGLSAGTYTVLVTDSAGNSGTDTVTITEPPPVVLSVSTGSTICKGESVTLTALASGGVAPYTYLWNPGAINTGSFLVSPSVTTTYTALVTDANGCTKSGTVKIIVSALPVAKITASNSGLGCAPDSVKLSTPPGNGYSFQWRKNGIVINGATDSILYTTSSGNYRVMVSKPNGCSKLSNPYAVTVATVTTSISPVGTVSICAGQTVQFTALPSTGYQYQWKKNGTNISGANQSTYLAATAGVYKVKVTEPVTQCFAISAGTTVLVPCRDGAFSEQVNIFPNPTEHEFTFDFGADQHSLIRLELYDLSGRMLKKFSDITPHEKLTAGGDLLPGTYFARIVTGDKTNIIRLLKTR